MGKITVKKKTEFKELLKIALCVYTINIRTEKKSWHSTGSFYQVVRVNITQCNARRT